MKLREYSSDPVPMALPKGSSNPADAATSVQTPRLFDHHVGAAL
jgi:hypothetical protein